MSILLLAARYFVCLSLLAMLFTGCKENKPDSKPADPITTQTPDSLNAINAPTLFATSNGRKIAYRIIGSGNPIIMCQRFRGNLDDWDPAFLDALAKNYQVITFDYSGFGLSTGEPSVTMEQFSKDVTDLAAYLELKKIVLAGWSFGGAVAQITMTLHPELISKLVLLGTKPPGKVQFGFEQAFLDRAYKPVNDLDDEIVLFFEPASAISIAAARASHDRIAARVTDRDSTVKQAVWMNYGKGFEDFAADPYQARKQLMNTSIPILVVSGDHEVCFPPENWFELNRKLPTTNVIIIPQAGHGPHHQYPEMIAGFINHFIKNK